MYDSNQNEIENYSSSCILGVSYRARWNILVGIKKRSWEESSSRLLEKFDAKNDIESLKLLEQECSLKRI